MARPAFRIPYTDIFPPAVIHPSTATSLPAALDAMHSFLTAPPRNPGIPNNTVVLTGAGLSVSSGLADYRGVRGTYRVNKAYRPIYYQEFLTSHEARKRYWARSFLGWPTLERARPNESHRAIGDLGAQSLVQNVITQNVDSFHGQAHPELPTVELHGYLRSTVCTSCRTEFPRGTFQSELARLNPAWQQFLDKLPTAVGGGAEETDDPDGARINPDGDVHVPNAPYATFRYPPCPACLAHPPPSPLPTASSPTATVLADGDGAWHPSSTAGILKPAVVMFGESIAESTRAAAEGAIDGAARLLVLATSLATYSALRLVHRAQARGMPIAVVNVGGVRGEEALFGGLGEGNRGEAGVRIEFETDVVLPALVERLTS